MNQSNRKKKIQKQLEISKLDEILWLSTPLGKLMNSINKKTRKVFLSSRPNKYTQRAWVVRIPNAFVIDRSKGSHGFQIVVIAETPDQALDIASETNNWEVLDFAVSDFQVFPNTPL